jgi:hypothetical protein
MRPAVTKAKGYVMKRLMTILLVVAITIIVLGCHKESEQDRIKKVITDIQTATEKKDVKKILNNLSKNNSDPQGLIQKISKNCCSAIF